MPKHIYTRMTTPPTTNDRMVVLQQICMDKHWCKLLAKRWRVSSMTIRRWTAAGLLGEVFRRNLQRVELSSMAVLSFEERHAAVLSVGEPVFNVAQLAKRYGVDRRTILSWRQKFRFPTPDKVPTSMMLRWRLSKLESWESSYGIVPKSHPLP